MILQITLNSYSLELFDKIPEFPEATILYFKEQQEWELPKF